MAKIPRDIDEYLYYNKEEFDKACREEMLEEAEQQAIEKGRAAEKREIAKEMLLNGVPIEQVSKYTKLSKQEIEELE